MPAWLRMVTQLIGAEPLAGSSTWRVDFCANFIRRNLFMLSLSISSRSSSGWSVAQLSNQSSKDLKLSMFSEGVVLSSSFAAENSSRAWRAAWGSKSFGVRAEELGVEEELLVLAARFRMFF